MMGAGYEKLASVIVGQQLAGRSQCVSNTCAANLPAFLDQAQARVAKRRWDLTVGELKA
jgi:hypothetical protein